MHDIHLRELPAAETEEDDLEEDWDDEKETEREDEREDIRKEDEEEEKEDDRDEPEPTRLQEKWLEVILGQFISTDKEVDCKAAE